MRQVSGGDYRHPFVYLRDFVRNHGSESDVGFPIQIAKTNLQYFYIFEMFGQISQGYGGTMIQILFADHGGGKVLFIGAFADKGGQMRFAVEFYFGGQIAEFAQIGLVMSVDVKGKSIVEVAAVRRNNQQNFRMGDV